MNQTSVFRSTNGREAIRSYYNGILSMLPLTQKTVDTPLGKTFVLEAGDTHNSPVILLHGSCSNSAAWLGDIPALAASHHVFAADIPGEPGNSEDRRLDIQSDEYPRWLCAIMDALAIQNAAIIGNSLGGWLALQFASMYPQRTSALVILAPSGLAKPKAAFMDQIATIAETTDNAKDVGKTMAGDTALPEAVLQFMALVAEHFIPITDALAGAQYFAAASAFHACALYRRKKRCHHGYRTGIPAAA